MSISESIIHRCYRCSNKECAAELAFNQKATEKFKKKCPFCCKHSLIIKSGSSNMSLIMGSTEPKTLGMLAERNTERMEKEGTLPPSEKKIPWWRKGKKKINFDILKNPKKYVNEGSI